MPGIIDHVGVKLNRNADLSVVLGNRAQPERVLVLEHGVLFERADFENRRRFVVGNEAERLPGGRRVRVRPREEDDAAEALGERLLARQEHHDVVDRVGVRDRRDHLVGAQVFEVGLHEAAGDKHAEHGNETVRRRRRWS